MIHHGVACRTYLRARPYEPQATDRFQLMAGCLSVPGLNQFLQRGPVKSSRELRPIISNKADVIDNRIVDHPLSIRAMELVFDFDRIPPAATPCRLPPILHPTTRGHKLFFHLGKNRGLIYECSTKSVNTDTNSFCLPFRSFHRVPSDSFAIAANQSGPEGSAAENSCFSQYLPGFGWSGELR